MAAPRALASVLAVVLEDMDLYTLDDFADFLDGGFAAAQLLVSRIRSDDIVAALHTSVTSDVMGVARAAAEHRLLDCELRSMEESANTLQLHAARGADAMAEKLILHEQLSKATAELVSTRQAAARRHEALRSTKTDLAAVKAKLAIAVQGRDAAELEVQAAKMLGVALLDAKAAQRAAETARDAAEAALADALAAEHALPRGPAMVNADTNTTYMVDGLGLATIGTQTDNSTLPCYVLLPHRHSPGAPPLSLPRSSSPPPHHVLPSQSPPPVPHTQSQCLGSPVASAPAPNRSQRVRFTYRYSSGD